MRTRLKSFTTHSMLSITRQGQEVSLRRRNLFEAAPHEAKLRIAG